MFEPIDRVERLMQAAAADPKQIPAFYAALLDAELFVPTPEPEVGPVGRRSLKANEPFNIATVGIRPSRPSGVLDRAGDVSRRVPKSNFWLNRARNAWKPLPAEEIALIMNRKISTSISQAPPRLAIEATFVGAEAEADHRHRCTGRIAGRRIRIKADRGEPRSRHDAPIGSVLREPPAMGGRQSRWWRGRWIFRRRRGCDRRLSCANGERAAIRRPSHRYRGHLTPAALRCDAGPGTT